MDGVEMNRPSYRKKYDIKTKYRILGTYYGKEDDKFLAEHEEVVVASSTFTYNDFLEIRNMNFMFYTVFNLNFHKWFFQFVKHLGITPSKFFSHFFKTYCIAISCGKKCNPTIDGKPVENKYYKN